MAFFRGNRSKRIIANLPKSNPFMPDSYILTFLNKPAAKSYSFTKALQS